MSKKGWIASAGLIAMAITIAVSSAFISRALAAPQGKSRQSAGF